jgi:uncharacterized peroxidase-related enzyme
MLNHERAFEARPDVAEAWRGLNGAIKANMDLRRYELATVAAARRLRSSYCVLAHGSVLMDNELVSPDELRAIVADHRDAGLDEVDVAVMDLAEKVVDDAGAITDADRDRLRALGLSDEEIFDVILAATARCFYSKTLDALDVRADAKYSDLDPALRETLVVGKAIAES